MITIMHNFIFIVLMMSHDAPKAFPFFSLLRVFLCSTCVSCATLVLDLDYQFKVGPLVVCLFHISR